jgi:hypothetical protein
MQLPGKLGSEQAFAAKRANGGAALRKKPLLNQSAILKIDARPVSFDHNANVATVARIHLRSAWDV